MPVTRIDFLGHRFDSGTMEEHVRTIIAGLDGSFRYVVTPNVHHIVTSLQQPAVMQPVYDQAWRVFCDSRVLSRLAWLTGRRLPVITGSDLTAQLVARAAEKRLTIALIGPLPAACDVLRSKYPGLTIECYTPPLGFINSEPEIQACVTFAVGTHANLLFIAVGMPQQEVLARKIADHPQARGVGLCVGASIDFLTGKQRRAPVWLQRAGLEWLHRLISDPRRLAYRYLVECPRIFYMVYSKHT